MKAQTAAEKRACARLAAADKFLMDARRYFAAACCACSSRRADADQQVLDALAAVDRARVEVRALFDANVGEGVETTGKPRMGRPPKVKPDMEDDDE